MSNTIHVSKQFSPYYGDESDDQTIAKMFRHHTANGFGRHVREEFSQCNSATEKALPPSAKAPLTFALRQVLPGNIS